MPTRGWRPHACALVLYAAVAAAFSWPLPLHLSTHLTGPVDGDTGVYVWNQWVFQHEILDQRSLPYFTGKIFSLTSRANLSLHNYTTFANLVALPLVKPLGIVATFNLVYLLMTVLSAYAMFLLARHLVVHREIRESREKQSQGVQGGQGESFEKTSLPDLPDLPDLPVKKESLPDLPDLPVSFFPEAWLAGLLFAWSPALVTRAGGHFSLVAAAPLPIFLLLLLRARARLGLRDGLALGACVAWAATTDVYYAVFCLMLATLYLAASMVGVHRRAATRPGRDRVVRWSLDVLIVCVGGLVLALAIGSGFRFTFLGRIVSVRSFYTPVLVMTVLLVLRAGWRYRAHVTPVERVDLWRTARLAAAAGVAAVIVLSPVLYAVGDHIANGRFAIPGTYWRTSPRGIDLLAMLVPNPNHPLAPDALRQWLTPRPDAYLEHVASLPFVALGVIAFAVYTGWRASRLWLMIAVSFGLLALGPFVHVAGLNTYVPGPWALLRYVPLVGLVRTPGRFIVIVMLALAALFALALAALAARKPRWRPVALAGVTVLLLAELLPAPRTLYSAELPHIYQRIAADPREDVRVLELPTGIRDGASSIGDFTARSQFHQTFHHKPLLGGYLSRVSTRRVREVRVSRVLHALIKLSEGRPIRAESRRTLIRQGPHFVRRARVGYVVIDRSRATDDLVEFAVKALRLQPVDRAGSLELYIPEPDR